jgi:hypothetical protein
MLKLLKKILAAIVIVCAVTPFFGLMLCIGQQDVTFYLLIKAGFIVDVLLVAIYMLVRLVIYCVKIIAE